MGTLYIHKNLGFSEEQKNILKSFITFLDEELQIETNYDIYLTDERKKYNIKTTAFLNLKYKFMVIYGKNRMIVDLIRSIAHEVVHLRQLELNQITLPLQDIGGKIEDEANAKAGVFVKKFTYQNENNEILFS